MIKKEFSSLLKSKGLKATMATVLLVPVLYSGTFLKSVWNPYDNTGNMKVGVVNLDQKVDFNGKTLEVGNSMVEKLKDNKKSKIGNSSIKIQLIKNYEKETTTW